MNTFAHSDAAATRVSIGNEGTNIVQISNFFEHPEAVVDVAAQAKFAHINPHYPGVRASVEPDLLRALCAFVSDQAAEHLSFEERTWEGQAWYSIVTRPAETLSPIQRLPHFDGFDEAQLAIMIYLNQTPHGGTAFYRHKPSGFERVTQARYPEYKAKLEGGVKETGLPPAAYITDGAPHFEKIFESDAAFNSLILYPGTSLHSGVIRNDVSLPSDPRLGRLTINGFFRPSAT